MRLYISPTADGCTLPLRGAHDLARVEEYAINGSGEQIFGMNQLTAFRLDQSGH
jgi:hypothetical protein